MGKANFFYAGDFVPVFSTFKEVQSQRNKGIDLLYEGHWSISAQRTDFMRSALIASDSCDPIDLQEILM